MTDETSIPWPKKSDVAFGGGHKADLSLPTIACIDRVIMHPNLTIHADAFREAADMIVDTLRDGQYLFPPDKFFLPIAFLYRHAIELTLKEAVENAIRIGLIDSNERTKEVIGGHSLHRIWNILKPAIVEFYPKTDEDSEEDAERIILQFHELDKSGQAFRYPKSKDGRPSFEGVTNLPRIVDLVKLKEVAVGLCSFLDACISGFDDAFSNMPEGEWG